MYLILPLHKFDIGENITYVGELNFSL